MPNYTIIKTKHKLYLIKFPTPQSKIIEKKNSCSINKLELVSTPYIDSRDFISLAPSMPLNLTKKSVSHDTATIEWEEPKYPNGIIRSYNLAKSKLGDPSFVLLEIDIVGKRIRYTINNLDSETTYSISVSGGT